MQLYYYNAVLIPSLIDIPIPDSLALNSEPGYIPAITVKVFEIQSYFIIRILKMHIKRYTRTMITINKKDKYTQRNYYIHVLAIIIMRLLHTRLFAINTHFNFTYYNNWYNDLVLGL
jgi:hypothetical protein